MSTYEEILQKLEEALKIAENTLITVKTLNVLRVKNTFICSFPPKIWHPNGIQTAAGKGPLSNRHSNGVQTASKQETSKQHSNNNPNSIQTGFKQQPNT